MTDPHTFGRGRRGLRAAWLGANVLAILPALEAQEAAHGPREATYTVSATTLEPDAAGWIPLRVALRVTHPPAGRAVLQIPVWTPGSYRLRDFPDRLHEVAAEDGEGHDLEVLALDRQSWQVRTGDAGEMVVRYRVDLAESDRFMMPDAGRRALTYEGPRVYLYLRDHLDVPCHVRFDVPDGWQVASGLVEDGEGSWFAPDYDFLADCPVKLGRFQRFSFTSHGKPIDVVLDAAGDVDFDHTTWLESLQSICDVEGDVFGGFPFPRYTFLFTASASGAGGGLEHLTSTAIGLPVGALEKDPRTGLLTVAHEFFHLWNVKCIRPRALGPFDYTRPNRTTALWLMEGVTSYYAAVAMARAGLLTAEEFWRYAAQQIGRLESQPGRPYVSSAQGSWEVWDTSPADRRLDYYNSGLVLGLLLDIEVRRRTHDARSLDDVMRALLALCRERGRGFDDADLPMVVGMVAGSDFEEWFDRYVRGTVTPPYADILAGAGLDVHLQRATRRSLRGLQRGDRPWWIEPDDLRGGRPMVGAIVSVDGQDVKSRDDVQGLLRDRPAGERVDLQIAEPNGDIREVSGEVVDRDIVHVELTVDPAASDDAAAVRTGITQPAGERR